MAVSRVQPAKLISLWLAFLIFFLFLVTIAQAAQVTLSLDPITPKAEGFRIFQRVTGESYNYQQPIWTGTDETCTIDNLVEGETYFFVARSFSGSQESADSNEVEYTAGGDISASPGGNIIDDGHPGASSIGTWQISGGANPYGTQSLYSKDTGAEYTFESMITGRHEVAIWWTPYASRCSAVPVLIYDGDVLMDLLTVNQQQNGGQWNTLGAYNFANQAKVVVVAEGDACSTCADAVKFTMTFMDSDSDGDGVIDPDDAFPFDPQEWSDADGDEIGDNADTDDDNDGMPDEWETIYGLNILVDDAQQDLDSDGVVNIDEYAGSTDPTNTDSDGDSVSDSADAFPLDATEWSDVDGDGIGDNADTDDDNDGMPDEWETQYGLNPLMDDALQDKDGDGVSNIDEYTGGTDPNGLDEEETIIIDDGQPGTFSTGTWKISGGADPYGTQSLFSKNIGAEYTFESMLTGRHEVAIWWTEYASRCSAVPVEIYDGDRLLETLTVNQQQDGGQWNVLGTYDFAGNAKVVLVSEDSACSTSADAAKFTAVKDEGPVIIDDGQPGTFSIGTWKISGGADPYGTQSLFSKNIGAEYTFESMLTGRHEVAIWWTEYASRCSAVPVEIYDGDRLLETLTVNQQQDGGQWNVLGTYDFIGYAKVVVVSEDNVCSTSADAIRYMKETSLVPQ